VNDKEERTYTDEEEATAKEKQQTALDEIISALTSAQKKRRETREVTK